MMHEPFTKFSHYSQQSSKGVGSDIRIDRRFKNLPRAALLGEKRLLGFMIHSDSFRVLRNSSACSTIQFQCSS
ncbi:hypothetical protein MPTK1_1g27900 [Marchantia polymorpha subsp. ruderalis]|uniref:Uncharacterized protein n=2 Tax=Marchantia polymorpha TaxID=3197 RepID=A0AAF6AV21_MARPO|nr:hypothetical protein MARPO_0002s0088 [Marchantia polymorpha]BBN00292.1 hypothetical protein Mp_1g27900 [Marchantia polymorpha subsp. ruderalis]|eukprot:PTQ49591.1 hypothetical protein MARPO_0002s0088 [Marchantia polymorpha]